MGRYRIETPVKGASGDIGPVHFHLGVAELDEIPHGVRQYCELNGYAITDTQAAAADEVEVGDDDNDPATRPPVNARVDVWRAHVLAIGADPTAVDGLTKDQLKELADQLATKESDQP